MRGKGATAMADADCRMCRCLGTIAVDMSACLRALTRKAEGMCIGIPRRFVPLRGYVRIDDSSGWLSTLGLAVAFFDRQSHVVGIARRGSWGSAKALGDWYSHVSESCRMFDGSDRSYSDVVVTRPTMRELQAWVDETGEFPATGETCWDDFGRWRHMARYMRYMQQGWGIPDPGSSFWYRILYVDDLEYDDLWYSDGRKGMGPINQKAVVFDEGRFEAGRPGQKPCGGIALLQTRLVRRGRRGVGLALVARDELHFSDRALPMYSEAKSMEIAGADAPVAQLHFCQAGDMGILKDRQMAALPADDALVWHFGDACCLWEDGLFLNVELAYEPQRALPLSMHGLEFHTQRTLRMLAKDASLSSLPLAYIRVTQRRARDAADVGAHVSSCLLSDVGSRFRADAMPFPFLEWESY